MTFFELPLRRNPDFANVIFQMKEIQDKISRFEKYELQMEREWQQLQQMKNMLFVDKLALLLNKTSAQNAGGSMKQDAKTE